MVGGARHRWIQFDNREWKDEPNGVFLSPLPTKRDNFFHHERLSLCYCGCRYKIGTNSSALFFGSSYAALLLSEFPCSSCNVDLDRCQ